MEPRTADQDGRGRTPSGDAPSYVEAGAGKTTTLAVIREGAEAAGYRVEGFAPTSRAAQKLGEAGMRTVRLGEIVRQKDPELREAVERLARGEVAAAIRDLAGQGRVHEVPDAAGRVQAIAKEYARSPENTLVVSPDNRSRAEINAAVRAELRAGGAVASVEHKVDTLVPRQDLTGADRAWAARYAFNDVLLYSRGSKQTGIAKGEYARVKEVDEQNNLLTVVRVDGAGRTHETTYDPRRQQGVSIYREQEKAFSAGDRIQFTAPARELKVANRELGTVERITDDGQLALRMDGGRRFTLDPRRHPHLDHGYAVTSHSAQGQTADRVLIHVDTELAARDLLNNRMAYVAVSRGARDAQIFTSDRERLPQALNRDVSHESAHVPERMEAKPARVPEREVERIYTPAEHERHWGPLTRAVPAGEAERFLWLAETGAVQSYQHAETGRNLHIDAATGQFLNQDRKAIGRDAALAHVLPEGNHYQVEMERQNAIRHSQEQRQPEHGRGFGLGL